MKYTVYFGEVYAHGRQVSHDGITRYAQSIDEAYGLAITAGVCSIRLRDTLTNESYMYCASFNPFYDRFILWDERFPT